MDRMLDSVFEDVLVFVPPSSPQVGLRAWGERGSALPNTGRFECHVGEQAQACGRWWSCVACCRGYKPYLCNPGGAACVSKPVTDCSPPGHTSPAACDDRILDGIS